MNAGYPDTFVMNRAMREAQMTSASDDRLWRSYDSGTAELDRWFGPALRAIGLTSLAQAKEWVERKSGRQATGLEIAGQGKAFAELGMAGIANCLAVGTFLSDYPQTTEFPRRRFAKPPITFVPGDIATQETWGHIRAATQHELSDPPNLILFTPAGGTSSMPEDPQFYESILMRSLELADRGPMVMVGEADPLYSNLLERRLLLMHADRRAQACVLFGRVHGLFALRRP